MSKKILKPNKTIRKINVDEIEIKTDIKKIIIRYIPTFIILIILVLCELYCMYRMQKINVAFLLMALIPMALGIPGFFVLNWNLKIYNSKMIIKYDFKTYIIDINKLVSIEPKHSQKSYRGAGGIIYYLNIIYEENQSLKEINLIYKYKSAYSLINYANIDQINYLLNSIEYKYDDPILDGDSLNHNINKKEIFMVIMIILIGWTILNIILFIMMKILGE